MKVKQQTKAMLLANILLVCLVQLTTSRIQVAAERRSIELDLKLTRDGNLYYTPMRIDGRVFKMLISSATENIWLLSDDRVLFDGGAERFKDDHSFGMGLKTIVVQSYTKEVLLGQEAIGNQSVTVSRRDNTLEVGNFEKYGVDGLLGIGRVQGSRHHGGSIVTNLFSRGLISHNLVSLYLNASVTEPDAVAGTMIFGATDERFYEGEIEYIPMEYHDAWGWSCTLNSIELDWSQVAGGRAPESRAPINERVAFGSSKSLFNLDSSAHLFTGIGALMRSFHVGHMKARPIRNTGVYTFDDCSLENKPDFVFTLAGREIRIKPADYVVKLTDDSQEICVSAFKGAGSFSFGTRLFRKYYVVLDYEHKRVGLARPKT